MAAYTHRGPGGQAAKCRLFRSATHAITNVGISLGAVGCAIAVQIGTADAYRALIAVNALTFLGAWLVSARLPKYEPLPAPDITWVAWLGAAVSPDAAPARPYYLRAPDAKPQKELLQGSPQPSAS